MRRPVSTEGPAGSSSGAQTAVRLPGRSRGQSLVEFALILPVLLLLVLTALDLGRAYMGWVVLNNAARVGANYAALHSGAWDSPGDATKRSFYTSLVSDARDDASFALAGCDAEAVPAPGFPNGNDLGDYAEVVLDCDFQPITPIIGDVFASTGNKMSVSARSVFPIRTGAVAGAAVTPPPSCLADFAFSPNGPFVGQTVNFTDLTPASADGWLWDFGDTNGSAVQNPSHQYATADTYTVKLDSRSNGTPCAPDFATITVVEAPPPPTPPTTGCVAAFTWDPASPVVGQPVTFTDGTMPAATNWTWDFGDGQGSSDQNPAHAYAAGGTYAVELAASDGTEDCGTFVAPITVTVPQPTCEVPSFIGSRKNDAQDEWSPPFTTTVQLDPSANQNQNWDVLSQSIVGGAMVACNSTIFISPSSGAYPP